jgi:hypothetical protein
VGNVGSVAGQGVRASTIYTFVNPNKGPAEKHTSKITISTRKRNNSRSDHIPLLDDCR